MKPFVPNKLPLEELDYKRLFGLVGEANAELARYDGLLQGIVNSAVLLSPITTQEAVLSSKIEGTQATVDEVLEHEAGLFKEGEKREDIREIVNYRMALIRAKEHIKDYPLNLLLIREMHKILLDSVRGQNKTPGDFRKDQNWIGEHGCPIEEATYVPPSPLILQQCLSDFENYMVFDDMDFVMQTGVVHAQFEIIHPFKDGNGRIGRILLPLFLYSKKKLSQPMFYLSEYLEDNREEYIQRLQNISKKGDWNGWLEFFLKAVISQSKENSRKVKNIMELYERMKDKIQAETHSQYTIQLLDFIFSKPIFQTSDFIKQTGIPKPTAMNLIRTLKKGEILIPVREASGRTPAILAFPDLLNIAEGKNVF